MRIKLFLFASLSLVACASQSTTMQPQKVVDLYPMFERHVNDCSNLVFALAVALWWADDLTWGDDGAEPATHRPVHTGAGGWMGA